MKKLCPIKAHWVDDFIRREKPRPGDSVPVVSYQCPTCKAEVPSEYARDYDQYRVTQVSLIGFTQQGKTVYLAAVLKELQDRVESWGDNYFSDPTDSKGWLEVERVRQLLERGLLPEHTQQAFPEPVILQVNGIPKPLVRRSRLLLYDTSGNAFSDEIAFEEFGGYAINSPTILLFIDLHDRAPGRDPARLLRRYLNLLKDKGIDPRRRTLVVVLTKGEMFRGRTDLPAVMKDFLESKDDIEEEEDIWCALERLSGGIEKFVDQHLPVFVRLARDELGAVKYCVVSALGTEPRSAPAAPTTPATGLAAALRTPAAALSKPSSQKILTLPVTPHGVLVPLFWLWGMQYRAPVRLNGVAYYSLPRAVELAEPNEAITFGPGRHLLASTLVIDRPLRLVGQKPATGAKPGEHNLSSRLVRNARGASVEIRLTDGGALAAENIWFERHQPSTAAARQQRRGETPADVVVVHEGSVNFRHCAFSGADWDLTGKHGGSGLHFTGNTTGPVVSCEAFSNGGFGIQVSDQATPDLENNQCCQNENAGLSYRGQAAGTATSNVCTDNEVAGIVLADGAQPTMIRNVTAPNGQYKVQDLRQRRGWFRR